MNYALDKDGYYEMIFATGPEYWGDQISEKFGLSELEKATLSSYLSFMHPEKLEMFSLQVLRSPRVYLEPFIDNELEEFGDEMFAVTYQDIFDKTVSGTRSRMILYTSFVQLLKGMSKEDRLKQYKALGVKFDEKEDKKTRREKLYTSYLTRIRGMKENQFQSYMSKGLF